MGHLKVLNDAPGYLKAIFQGPQGSGKSMTSVLLAIEAWRRFGSKKPIAFYDTEKGSDFLAGLIEKETGMKPLRVKARALKTLIEVVGECVAGASDVLLADSITHVWREVNDSYKAAINRDRQVKKLRFDVNDIGRIKEIWQPWPDLFLNSPLHIIVSGREGNEFGHEEDEDTGKRELVTTGKKMKVEGEFGYEGHLVVAMSSPQNPERRVRVKPKGRDKGGVRIDAREHIIVATVLKDRTNTINGQRFEWPTGATFAKHLDQLRPEADSPVNTELETARDLDEGGRDEWRREKEDRAILVEEIEGLMVSAIPGQTAAEKKDKIDLLAECFETRSWKQMEQFSSAKLRMGRDALLKALKRRADAIAQQASGDAPEPENATRRNGAAKKQPAEAGASST